MANGFSYDRRLARYRAPNGRFLAEREVRGVVDAVIDASAGRMKDLAGRLRSGDVSLPDWQMAMRREIKLGHLVSATAAHGGWDAMTPREWGLVGQRLRQQYQYLDGMAADIASGKQSLNGRLDARAASYAQSSRGTYEEIRRRDAAEERGVMQERRIRHVSDSCAGCVEQAAMGWQLSGVLSPIGTQECRSNCKCTWQTRTVTDLMEAA